MSDPDSGLERAAERGRLLAQIDAGFAATAGETGLAEPGVAVHRALLEVPRHRFVPDALQAQAWEDRPLPIGEGQTISQPFIVALMTALAEVGPDDAVLEVGTGCGYQTAVLARLARHVHSIEILPRLAAQAREHLGALGVANVSLHVGDGHAGWPAGAPYDAIVVTAAPPTVPPALLAQLRPGGRLVLPQGATQEVQRLLRIDKHADGSTSTRHTLDVRFVPMTGAD